MPGWSQQDWSQFSGASGAQYGAVEYAGFLRRFAAQFIDGFVVGIGTWIVVFALAVVFYASGFTDDEVQGFAFLAWLMCYWIYFAVLESSSWQATLGKRALGIIVTDERGERLTFGRATGRYWAKWLSYLTFLVGFAMAGFTRKKQALHDVLANTLVVVGKHS